MDNNKLFVGGLSWNTTEDALRQLFEGIGPVLEAKIITDKMTGRSRGFGFVTMENAEDAAKAVEQLNDTEFDGRKIAVNEARPEKRDN